MLAVIFSSPPLTGETVVLTFPHTTDAGANVASPPPFILPFFLPQPTGLVPSPK